MRTWEQGRGLSKISNNMSIGLNSDALTRLRWVDRF